MPMKKVTKMFFSLPSHEAVFSVCMMLAGLVSCTEAMRNMECTSAMMMADGTPLPLTSPMQKNSFSSRRKKS